MKQTENTSVNATDLTGVLKNSHTCHNQSENVPDLSKK